MPEAYPAREADNTLPVDYGQFDHPNWLIGGSKEQERYADKFERSDFLRRPERFVPARISDYAVWLEGHLAHGGQATDVLDEPWATSWERDAVTAVQDFTVDGEYGGYARPVVALPGVKISGTYEGIIYTLDGYRLVEVMNNDIRDSSFSPVHIYAIPEFGRVRGIQGEVRRLYARDMQTAKMSTEEYAAGGPSDVRTRYKGFASRMGITLNDY